MMEKARRTRIKSQSVAASDANVKPDFKYVPSLVLNKKHPLSDLYYKKARYKVYWGGRGASKSWGFAEALIRMTASLPLLVLCVREFQVSIADSSHRLLVDTIERLGMQSWFTVTATSIKSRSGAQFIFKGLHGNTAGIRSTEGVDICWVEEAQSVSAASWKALAPTIRKLGSEIWVSYNLIDERDATHQRFVNADDTSYAPWGSPRRSNSIVHKINYDQNPYFAGTELEQEMQDDLEADYDLYEHIWLGMPLKKSDAIVFNGKYRVAEFDETELYDPVQDRLYYGLDFGFAADPAAFVRMFIVPKERAADGKARLYVTHCVMAKGVETTDYPLFLDQIPGASDWPIFGDSSRPETISAIRNAGYAIEAADKWDGSVKDGITHLRGFHEIVIHSKQAKPLADEAYLYRYKVDPKVVDERGQALVLPVVVDKHNHGWDASRYALNGHITRGGELGIWDKLGRAA